MESFLKTWETSRKLYLKFLESYTLDQLNTIPQGLSNNMIWQAGHIIVSQQKLMYTLSNLPINISQDMVVKYQNGSRPDGNATQEEVDEIKVLLLSTVEQFKLDWQAGKFTTFNEYQSQTGFHLATFQDAVTFNTFHEGIHFGMLMYLKKLV
ncbi:DinB family protein [Flavobacterium sp. N1719]|uniref:DinB family protein n=1 Tax=Flavobacterium sp. N1719 TaxID=2885633 RepID=UPI002223DAA9|nr:DinB family protein [Flavobacterium sp. N1719]